MPKSLFFVNQSSQVVQTFQRWVQGYTMECVSVEPKNRALSIIMRNPPWGVVICIDEPEGALLCQDIRSEDMLSSVRVIALSNGSDVGKLTEHMFGEFSADCYGRLPLENGIVDVWLQKELSNKSVTSTNIDSVENANVESNTGTPNSVFSSNSSVAQKIQALELDNFEKSEKLSTSNRNLLRSNDALQQANSQVQQLQQEVFRLEGQLQSLASGDVVVANELVHLRELVQSLEKEKHQAQKSLQQELEHSDKNSDVVDVASLERALRDLHSQRDEKIEQINNLHGELQLSREVISSLQMRTQKAEERLSQAQDISTHREQQLQKDILSLQQQLSAISRTLEASQLRESELNQKIGKLQYTLDVALEAAKEDKLQKQILQQLLQQSEQRETQQQELITQLQSSTGGATTDASVEYTQHRNAIKKLEAQVQQHVQTIHMLQDKITKIQQAPSTIKDLGSHSAVQQEIARQQQLLDSTLEALEQSLEKQEMLDTELRTEKNINAQLQTQLQTQSMVVQNEQTAVWQAKMQDLEQQLAHSNEQLASVQQEMESVQKHSHGLEQHLRKIEEDAHTSQQHLHEQMQERVQQVKNLEEKNGDLQIQLDNLLQVYKQTQGQLEQSILQNSILISEKASVLADLAPKEKAILDDISHISGEKEHYEAQLRAYLGQLEQLEQQKQQLLAAVEDSQSIAELLMETVIQAEQKQQQVEDKLSNMQSVQEEMERLQEHHQLIQAQLDEAKEQVRELEEHTALVINERDEMWNMQEQVQQQLDALEQERQQTKVEIDALQEQLQVTSVDKQSLQQEQEKLQQQISMQTVEIAQHQQELRSAKDAITQMQQTLDGMSVDVENQASKYTEDKAQLQAEIEVLLEKIAQQTTKHETAQTSLIASQEMLAQTEQTAIGLQFTVDELHKQIATLQNELAHIEASSLQVEASTIQSHEYSELQVQIAQLENILQEEQGLLAQKDNDIQFLQQELLSTQNHLHAVEQQFADAQSHWEMEAELLQQVPRSSVDDEKYLETVQALHDIQQQMQDVQLAQADVYRQLDKSQQELKRKEEQLQEVRSGTLDQKMQQILAQRDTAVEQLQDMELEKNIAQSTARQVVAQAQLLKDKSMALVVQLQEQLASVEDENRALRRKMTAMQTGLSSLFVQRPNFIDEDGQGN